MNSARVSHVENVDSISEDNVKKRRKRSKKRKRSDPAVTNISVLLSASLNLVSPENTLVKCQKRFSLTPKNIEKCTESNDINKLNPDLRNKNTKPSPDSKPENTRYDEKECLEVECPTIDVDTPNEPDTKQQSKNAFEFMMESRNKIIGRNSPGKEMDINNTLIPHESKEKLLTRKQLFEKWAVMKGSKKHKAEERETEIVINQKLAKRKRKLKKMLSLNRKEQIKANATVVFSDSENSQDTEINEIENGEIPANFDKHVNLNKERQCNNGSKSKEYQVNRDIVGDFSKNKNNNSKGIGVRDNINKSVKDNSQKNSLDTFISVSTSKARKRKFTDHDDDFESDNNVNTAKESLIKIKMFSPKVFKRTRKTSATGNVEDIALKKQPGKEINNGLKKKFARKGETGQPSLIQKENSKKNANISKIFKEHQAIDLNTTDDSSNDSACLITNLTENYPRRSLRTSKRQCNSTYKDNIFTYVMNSDSDDCSDKKEEEIGSSKSNKMVKLAPIFIQTKPPKVKVDTSVLEARKKFLMSGIPDALKRNMEKRQSFIVAEPNLFPEISHVQQRSVVDIGIDFWNLPKVNLDLVDVDVSLPDLKTLTNGAINVFSNAKTSKVSLCPPQKIKNQKSILLEIKRNNLDYPVFRTFRLLKEKAINLKEREAVVKHKKKRISRNCKRKLKSGENTTCSNDLLMWTEKYKATTFEDLIGNQKSVLELKKWLQSWVDASENNALKSKRGDSSSSEFDCDSRSCDSTSYPGNAVMLYGPHGSGKTMTIYALCNELGINVLELNASTRRTGKRLLQELQEATQSHQVRKRGKHNLNRFVKSVNVKDQDILSSNNESSSKHTKICLLLLEDVDIVFEQDDGFFSALIQLLSTSKRPIILSATDISSPNLHKIVSQACLIKFSPLSPKILAVWLQILCLLEGYFVSKECLSELLEWNRGDARKTLLQLQFWIQSGGGKCVDIVVKSTAEDKNVEVVLLNDDTRLSIEETDEAKEAVSTFPMHINCTSAFVNEELVTLENVWWNNSKCLHNMNTEKSQSGTSVSNLQGILKYLDTNAEIDRRQRRCGVVGNTDLSVRNSTLRLRDSIELSEVFDYFNARTGFIGDWTHELISGFKSMHKDLNKLDMSLPTSEERKCRNKQRSCKRKYMEIVPLSYSADRRALTLDYYPSLRTITRSEKLRFAHSQKRKNRFFNYLRNLEFHGSDSIMEIACNTLYSNCCYEKGT